MDCTEEVTVFLHIFVEINKSKWFVFTTEPWTHIT